MVFSRTVLVLVVGLAACGQGAVQVEVSGTAQDVRFAAIDAKGGGEACVERLSVTPSEPEAADPVWQVTAVDPTRCIATLHYGEPTDRFAQVRPATPLRRGVSYRVRVSGAGFSIVRDFRITPNAVIMQD